MIYISPRLLKSLSVLTLMGQEPAWVRNSKKSRMQGLHNLPMKMFALSIKEKLRSHKKNLLEAQALSSRRLCKAKPRLQFYISNTTSSGLSSLVHISISNWIDQSIWLLRTVCLTRTASSWSLFSSRIILPESILLRILRRRPQFQQMTSTFSF